MIISTDKDFHHPVVQSISKDNEVTYRLADDFCYQWEEGGEQWRRVVFREDANCGCDWKTDLASVPDAAALVGFRKLGTSDAAAIIHDRGYQLFGAQKVSEFPKGEYQTLVNGEWVDAEPRRWTRLKCDRLYKRMCISGGMSRWRAEVEFLALRVGAFSKRNGLKWYFS